MLLYSFRFNRRARRSALLLLLLLGVMAAGRLVLDMLPGDETAPTGAAVKKQAGKTEEQRQEFIASLGWQVETEPDEIAEVIIPREFDDIYTGYNAIQKEQGMDLARYRGKRCKRYSYAVLNHPGGVKNIRLNLLVCGNKIIGGDVCSLGLDGFLQGLGYPAEKTEPAAAN